MITISGSNKLYLVGDDEGEFGFIKFNEKKNIWEFKITEEVFSSREDLEIIVNKMKELEKNRKFKIDDQVRILYDGIYYYGQITIIGNEFYEGKYKVLFNGNSDLNYTYYNENELELVVEENLKE